MHQLRCTLSMLPNVDSICCLSAHFEMNTSYLKYNSHLYCERIALNMWHIVLGNFRARERITEHAYRIYVICVFRMPRAREAVSAIYFHLDTSLLFPVKSWRWMCKTNCSEEITSLDVKSKFLRGVLRPQTDRAVGKKARRTDSQRITYKLWQLYITFARFLCVSLTYDEMNIVGWRWHVCIRLRLWFIFNQKIPYEK